MDGPIRLWKCRKAILRDLRTKDLLPYLRLDLVISLDEEELIQKEVNSTARTEKLFWILLGRLRSGQHYERFLEALNKTYPHLAEALLDVHVTQDDKRDFHEASGKYRLTSAKQDIWDSQAVLDHCESYRLNLMNVQHLGDSSREVVDENQLYIEEDMYLGGESRVAVPLDRDDLFREVVLDDQRILPAPRTILLSGAPGVGKSVFLRKYAYDWSLRKLDGERTPWTIVILLPANSIGGSDDSDRVGGDVWTAVEEHIQCHHGSRRDVMAYLRSDGEHALIAIDAIDEVRDAATVRVLRAFVDERKRRPGPKVILSTRTSLSAVESVYFHRHVTLPGFTLQQGVCYVRRYVDSCPEVGEEGHRLAEVVARDAERLRPVLTNPLWAGVVCVTACERLLWSPSPDSHQGYLRLARHLQAHEVVIRQRELDKSAGGRNGNGSCESASSAGDEEEYVLRQAEAFYRLCLHGLMTDIRGFTDEQLRSFGIDSNSPYRAFLVTRNEKTLRGRRVRYAFQHEVMYEYFASQSLRRRPDLLHLLHLAARKEFRNLQRLVFSTLAESEDDDDGDDDEERESSGEDEQEALLFMIRATIVLQGDIALCSPQTKAALMEIRAMYQSLPRLARVTDSPQNKYRSKPYPSPCHDKQVKKIQDEINCIFAPSEPRYPELFYALTEREKEERLLKHLSECLQELPEQRREALTRASLHQLLPSTRAGQLLSCQELNIYLPTPPARWGMVKLVRAHGHPTQVTLNAWTPAELPNLWWQYRKIHQPLPEEDKVQPDEEQSAESAEAAEAATNEEGARTERGPAKEVNILHLCVGGSRLYQPMSLCVWGESSRGDVGRGSWCSTVHQLSESLTVTEQLVFHVSAQCDLEPLLEALLRGPLDKLLLPETGGPIRVWYGRVTIAELSTWWEQYGSCSNRRPVELMYPAVVMDNGRKEEWQRQVTNATEWTIDGSSVLIYPDWVDVDGKNLWL